MTVIEDHARPTLLRPPEHDESKSLIENVLDVTEIKVLGPVSCASFFFSFFFFPPHHLVQLRQGHGYVYGYQ
jgi:hypothetical protein